MRSPIIAFQTKFCDRCRRRLAITDNRHIYVSTATFAQQFVWTTSVVVVTVIAVIAKLHCGWASTSVDNVWQPITANCVIRSQSHIVKWNDVKG